MLFYDDFIKKIESKEVALVGKYSYTLELKKKLMWLGTGVPLLLMGVFQAYTGTQVANSIPYYLFAVVLAGLGVYHFKQAFSYRVTLDFDRNNLVNNKLDLHFNEIDSITLKRMVAPGSKKLQACLDIITTDRKEIIIPLIMTKKVEFVALLRKKLQGKFKVVKD